ncbi:MAG: zinc-ribbon domain-containing protein [Clostridia bacterium]|nr:zinc-ribbon domain-containing protein [Clostridia bacterium]
MALIRCKECGKQISSSAESCPNCGYTELKCPKCGSNKVKVISGASKAMSVALWGAFAANKVMSKYQCKTCGHKF